jgi:hypothetical protein
MEVELLVSKQLVYTQTRMAQELCVSLPHVSKLVSLPQLEWISLPQPDIPDSARVHFFKSWR